MIEQIPLTDNERRALDTFVRRLYADYGDRVRSVVLFGSKARGDAGPDSDVDVLVTLADDDPNATTALCHSEERSDEESRFLT